MAQPFQGCGNRSEFNLELIRSLSQMNKLKRIAFGNATFIINLNYETHLEKVAVSLLMIDGNTLFCSVRPI